ncbi:hypothetical protein [Nonomuraea sp. NPDC050643]|uniref:hypothetical protein n=1 Tax=Nonomuraea sp. NPDC050643 TaxID=3155660 RepID=UPI0033D68054
MAIVLESSPSLVSTTNGSSLTTASFTAPDNSVVVACSIIGQIPTISNSDAALTWTSRKVMTDDRASVWTAPVVAERTGLTVTAVAQAGGSFQGALSVYVFTGVELSAPVGADGNGTSTTNNVTVNGYSSTKDGSRGLAIARDTSAGGTPTSTDDERAWAGLLNIAAMSITKSANTATSGTTVTFNLDAAGAAAAAWTWIAVELVPTLPFQRPRISTQPAAVHRASSW